MPIYTPPYTLTPFIVQRVQLIMKSLGRLEGQQMTYAPFSLRRDSQLQTIHSSLAIEGNTLTFEQVTLLSNGKRVLGPPKDIMEAKNALELYEHVSHFDPLKIDDFLKAHAWLMKGLLEEPGQWRHKGVGIFKGKEVSHVAPPAHRVPHLMNDLFDFVKQDALPWLLKACLFHYELEFIHPFMDGNGRMGRLWQQCLLMKEHPLFEWIPIEVLVRENQKAYYDALAESDALGEATPFLSFSLDIIHQTLHRYEPDFKTVALDAQARLLKAKPHLLGWFSRKEYQVLHPTLSTATASRDLSWGLHHHLLENQGLKNQTHYRFIPSLPS